MKTFIFLLLAIITSVSVASAQNQKDRIEIGVQSTSLTLFHPDASFDDTSAGIGGRVTYNLNRSIAAEAEINFFPQKQLILTADGSAIQAQFGVKAGKRFEKFGLFGKVRPGFLSVSRVGSFIPGTQFEVTIERRAFFTIDTGGVLELYPSRRTVVRFEVGDTVVRHPARFGQTSIFNQTVQFIRPAKFNHNFQFTAGVAFRLGDFPDEQPDGQTSEGRRERTKRFEVGAQFTSLFVEPEGAGSRSVTLPRRHAEPGFGGRFTLNLTEVVALEAEGNYYTRNQVAALQGGHMYQGQFGAKVGKRFDRWGLFGKFRPGFVGFSRVLEFFPGVPGFGFERKHYPSFDAGGVIEIYISRRWMARFDVGDTMIRYDEVRVPSLPQFVVQREETRHNPQVTSGIGFRF